MFCANRADSCKNRAAVNICITMLYNASFRTCTIAQFVFTFLYRGIITVKIYK